MPTLSFIGCGRLGRSLGHLFNRLGVFTPGQVLTRHADTAAEAVRFIGGGEAITSAAQLRPADVFLIAAPDDALAEVSVWLAETGLTYDGVIVMHCSGALSSRVLSACAARGAQLASVHPLLSFAEPAQVVKHFDCHCCIEGDIAAVAMLSQAFARIGAKVLDIPTDAKLRYHAAAVIASNYLVTLTEQAVRAIGSAGLSRDLGRELLLPLMRQTLVNLEQLEPRQALTGPVARGDWSLVEAEGRDLSHVDPELGRFYLALASVTARMVGKTCPFEEE